jgi:hypothetical protein
MNRRTLLSRFGAVLVGGTALSGCLGSTGGPSDGTERTESTATTSSGTKLVERSFEVVGVSSGTVTHEAAVTVDGGTVTVEGTIPGNDGCYTAELRDVAVDGGLRVTVASVRRETTETPACTQAIVEIDYRATFRFDGPAPEDVRVLHEAMGETKTVATTA